MLQTKKKLLVVVPCYNECDAIANVLKKFPTKQLQKHKWQVEIVVIDNNSTDGTSEVARQHGATVINEPQQGKGHAVMTGLQQISNDTDYIVMLDGDDTYHPKEILRMIEPLDSGFCDVILGSRLQGKMKDGSMGQMSRVGNWFFSFLVRYFYRVNVTDVLTGYFAWKTSALDALLPHLKSRGFEIEMDMITKMARLGLEVYSVPISYHPRVGDSKLNHVSDGWKILKTFVANLWWSPPTRYIDPQPKTYRSFSPESV
jgi:dolichol-phosphate mannosyltransferase